MTIQDTVGMVYGAKAAGVGLGSLAKATAPTKLAPDPTIRQRVLENIAKSKAARESSGFSLVQRLGTVTGKYSAIKPGPLNEGLAETFSGGKYKEIILSQDTDFYRAGVDGKPFGQFFRLDKPQSVIQTRIDQAVLPKWPNGNESPLNTIYRIKIPAGTKVYVGNVGYQNGFYLGGTQQIVITAPWKIPGTQLMEKSPLL
ncbi:hypothetical protein [Serratia microhaemolytica]|uniref:hypothetical protein n=1 Tax=Serratia microhaemolytica TaxID=2675110 RepID=UPI000FDDDC16|nr:hypothetical protein [Serratia microhaemolytica]